MDSSKFPTKESRRIEIVAPVDKGKRKDIAIEEVVELPTEESEEARSEPRYSIEGERSKGRRSTDNKLGYVKTELWPAVSVLPRNASRSHDDLPETETEWYMPDFLQPSASKSIHEYVHTACDISSRSQKFDRSVLQILDEQLDAIMGKESEETIAATLETIIEICSTSSVVTTPRRARFESSPTTDLFDFRNSEPDTSQNDLEKIASSSQVVSPTTNQFFTLEDFADDDVVLGSTSLRESKSHQGDDGMRPRSADSSSTAPLTPFGSPHTPKIIDIDQRRLIPLDQTPLRGRVEQMMSCAAARCAGQCSCGLGDWFHHVIS